jgi:hypothetical protein
MLRPRPAGQTRHRTAPPRPDPEIWPPAWVFERTCAMHRRWTASSSCSLAAAGQGTKEARACPATDGSPRPSAPGPPLATWGRPAALRRKLTAQSRARRAGTAAVCSSSSATGGASSSSAAAAAAAVAAWSRPTAGRASRRGRGAIATAGRRHLSSVSSSPPRQAPASSCCSTPTPPSSGWSTRSATACRCSRGGLHESKFRPLPSIQRPQFAFVRANLLCV